MIKRKLTAVTIMGVEDVDLIAGNVVKSAGVEPGVLRVLEDH
jgi:hypothetical protein